MKRARISNGSVVRNKRFGSWNFLWFGKDGTRRSRKIGNLNDFSREQALKKADALRQELRFEPQTDITSVRILVEQYQAEKMPTRSSTSRVYKLWFKKYVLPRWGEQPITNLQPRPVELWLSSLELAPKTRGHIRGLLHILWDYAMWSGAVPVQPNPIALVTVRGTSKRTRKPRSLNVDQFHKLAADLREPFKTMALVSVCLGLRVSELLALKWGDVDWRNSKLNVERGIVNQMVDDVKTDGSRKLMTLVSELLAILRTLKQASEFQSDEDWIFASPLKLGRLPYSYTGYWRELQRAGVESGIGQLGTHAFRHTYRSWLDAVGTPIAVQQKLMRHSDIRTTMNIYGSVVTDEMEKAGSLVAALALRPVN
ncbi:MAG TPA: site-specific integrase [Terriglobales bacterium]